MSARNYKNTALDTTIVGAITAGDTIINVSVLSGYPAAPFIARLDADTASEEVVLVTNVAGTSLTCTRGYDGTTAKSHLNNSVFDHVAAAIDYSEPNAHIQASTAVHGVAGAVVGTTDSQTLSNKILSASTLSGVTALSTASAAGLKIVKGSAGFTPDLLTLTLEDGTTIVFRVTPAGNVTVVGTLAAGNTTLGTLAAGVTTITGTIAASGKISANASEDVAGLLKVTGPTLDATVTEIIYPVGQASAALIMHALGSGTNSATIGPLGVNAATLVLNGFSSSDLINAVSGRFKVDQNGRITGSNYGPCGQARQTVLQTLTTGVSAPVTMDAEDYDSDGFHSTSSNTSRVTPTIAGWYRFSGGVGFASASGGFRTCEWRKNGTAVNGGNSQNTADSANQYSTMARTLDIQCNGSTDYVELYALQTQGGNLNTAVSAVGLQSTLTWSLVNST